MKAFNQKKKKKNFFSEPLLILPSKLQLLCQRELKNSNLIRKIAKSFEIFGKSSR